jgi:hypothetical protein
VQDFGKMPLSQGQLFDHINHLGPRNKKKTKALSKHVFLKLSYKAVKKL